MRYYCCLSKIMCFPFNLTLTGVTMVWDGGSPMKIFVVSSQPHFQTNNTWLT